MAGEGRYRSREKPAQGIGRDPHIQSFPYRTEPEAGCVCWEGGIGPGDSSNRAKLHTEEERKGGTPRPLANVVQKRDLRLLAILVLFNFQSQSKATERKVQVSEDISFLCGAVVRALG